VLAFGSCHIHDAVAGLGAKRLARPSWTRPVLTYSTSEALQLLRWSRGELTIPPHLLPLTSLTEERPPAPPHPPDAVFLEVATNVEIRHGSVVVSRESLTRRVFEPALALGRAEGRVAKRWYHQGLQRGDETLRAALAAELADLVRRRDGRCPDMDLVLGARSHRQDPAEVAHGIEEMREAVGRPLCVVSTPAVYTRDGRPVSWPTYFPGELAEICRAIDVPLLSLSDLVARHGVELSVQPDLHHYTPAFIGVLGDAMMAMTRRLLGTDDQAGRTLEATTEPDGPEKARER
jgi:hypothetical protein